jgi:hypothetical protein
MPDDDRGAGRFPLSVEVRPEPKPEEVAAIVAALGSLSEELREDLPSLKRSRWRLAGDPGMKLEGSLWAYSRWEG